MEIALATITNCESELFGQEEIVCPGALKSKCVNDGRGRGPL